MRLSFGRLVTFLSLLVLKASLFISEGAVVNLRLHFSESSLDPSFTMGDENRLFGVNWYTCLENTNISTSGSVECPLGQATFVPSLWITTEDYVSPGTWLKSWSIPDSYIGQLIIEVFAPLC